MDYFYEKLLFLRISYMSPVFMSFLHILLSLQTPPIPFSQVYDPSIIIIVIHIHIYICIPLTEKVQSRFYVHVFRVHHWNWLSYQGIDL